MPPDGSSSLRAPTLKEIFFLGGGAAAYWGLMQYSMARLAFHHRPGHWTIIFFGVLITVVAAGIYLAAKAYRRHALIGNTDEIVNSFIIETPIHPALNELIAYVAAQLSRYFKVEHVLVMLRDKERAELYFQTAQGKSAETGASEREVRFPEDQGLAGQALLMGRGIIASEGSPDALPPASAGNGYGFEARTALYVPLPAKAEAIGVLGLVNRIGGDFTRADLELLTRLAAPIALALENTRLGEQLCLYNDEMTALNTAKTKMINHLSHELKTPLAVIASSLQLLGRPRYRSDDDKVRGLLERAGRQVDRLIALSGETEDITFDQTGRERDYFLDIIQSVKDLVRNISEGNELSAEVVDNISTKLDEALGAPVPLPVDSINLSPWIMNLLDRLRPYFRRRNIELWTSLAADVILEIPEQALTKAVAGIIRNAIEYTPDGGLIEIKSSTRDGGVSLDIVDHGVGMTKDTQMFALHGFVHAGETNNYSSGKAYDFGAGGGGADLLRIKILSERYRFKLSFTSSLCGYIDEASACCGNNKLCPYCETRENCLFSGGTTFTLQFSHN